MRSWQAEAVEAVIDRLTPHIHGRLGTGRRADALLARFRSRGLELFDAYFELYGWKWDFAYHFEELIQVCIDASAVRRKRLRKRDQQPVDWIFSNSSLIAMTYTDRFVGRFEAIEAAIPHLQSLGVSHLHLMPPYAVPEPDNDGGYAVEDYHRTRADLGSIADLEQAIDQLADHEIDVILDFVTNHTADTHEWAKAAAAGDPSASAFYHVFADRSDPDRYSATLRSIFPDGPGDAFVWVPTLAGGSWVWSTFHDYQWDLNYRNPRVTNAMVGEMLHLANLGVGVIRADATPFLWKEMGTACENLDQAHTIMRIFSSCLDLVAPSVRLLSEAIVHPDDVVRFIRPDEAHLGYNPLIMSSVWEALATRDVRLLEIAVRERMELPDGCQWVTYLRCHDDIGWGFADEDARQLDIDPGSHRKFLNDFYSGAFEGSFARGQRFQDNPLTGDARISGTLASLAGLDQALQMADPELISTAISRILLINAFMLSIIGVPLLYLGDEIGQLNDVAYLAESALAGDNRWMHRPPFAWETLTYGDDGTGAPGQILGGVRSLIQTRAMLAALDGPDSYPRVVETTALETIAFVRSSKNQDFLGVFNFSERVASIELDLDGWMAVVSPLLVGSRLGPYTFGWYVRDQS